MNRKDQIRLQLLNGLPETWVTEDVVEAVALAMGNRFMLPAPEMAEPRHGIALLQYAAKITEEK